MYEFTKEIDLYETKLEIFSAQQEKMQIHLASWQSRDADGEQTAIIAGHLATVSEQKRIAESRLNALQMR